jgi:Protein of unknown function (DUF4230)
MPTSFEHRGQHLLLVGLLLGLAFGALFVVLVVGRASQDRGASVWSAILRRSTTVDLSQPAVVNRIQQLQRLETVDYSLDKIVAGQRENNILPDFLTGDRLLLLVHGEVIAGVDFGQLGSKDVSLRGREIHLRIPEPKILIVRLDSTRTRVYMRTTGVLVPVDPNLESQVREAAERQLQDAAVQDGILNHARKNARTTLGGLLKSLGFEQIDFD